MNTPKIFERVKNVLSYKKPAFWILTVGIIAIIIASVCLLTNPTTLEIKAKDYFGISELYSNSIDYILYDIDNDGKNEACVLGYGPTSGLFTFTLTVYENDAIEYFNIYTSSYFDLSFEKQNGMLRLKGISQENLPQIAYFDFVIKDEQISLVSDTQNIDYWGEQGIDSPFAPKEE